MEHPAHSHAWPAFGLTAPPASGWGGSDAGWVCEVWQSAYGHRAAKATWLYYCGDALPVEARWDRRPGTHQVGFQDQRGKAANKPRLSKREANGTPPAFARWLVDLAGGGRG